VDWEEEMKKSRMILLAALLVAVVAAPASAWEFAMTGQFQWTYEYYGQNNAGFFGEHDNVGTPYTSTAAAGSREVSIRTSTT